MTSGISRLKSDAAAARAAIMEQMRSGYSRMLGLEEREAPAGDGNLSPGQDPRLLDALEWVKKIGKELENEHVPPSNLLRLLSEAMGIIEAFISPVGVPGENGTVDPVAEAERILFPGGPRSPRSEIVRALQILNDDIERAAAEGKEAVRSRKLRDRAYSILTDMDGRRAEGE